MSARLLTIALFLVVVTGCSSVSSRWQPNTAALDAQHDIAAGHIRFAYIGGFVPVAPGIREESYDTLQRYDRLKVGPQGCIQDEHRAERLEYARRYNEAMWAYVSRQH
jgi:hypothetical protein